MSKPSSGHFQGTTGSVLSMVLTSNQSEFITAHNSDIIDSKKLDTREHPTKYKQLSSKKLQSLRQKEENRTITKAEYKHKEWQRRLTARRNEAIKKFWKAEKRRIKHNLPTTRNWSAEQRKDILSNKRPKYDGKPMASHHTYSVSKYPHLSNKPELIYPVTLYEHIYGWHGGNTKNSLPGKPIKNYKPQF